MDLAKKNNELAQLLNQISAELGEKIRELEIEAALEQVRTVALSMQKPDDLLDVCKIISDQLEALNVKNIRNVQLAIIDEERKNYANYQYFTAYSKKVFEETIYGTNPSVDGMVRAMQKSVNSFFIGSIQGEELKKFIEWRNNNDQFPDPLLDESDVTYYYFYSIGKGGLGLTTYKEISNESLEIFKRFHKVFTLAYRRFKDIWQALEQAREAQIEAALERVRAASLAMHKTDELKQVIETVFSQLRELKLPLDACYIDIFEQDNYDLHIWVGNGMETYPDQLTLPYLDHPLFKLTKKARLKGESFFTLKDAKKSKDRFVRYLAANYDVAQERIDLMLASEGVDMSVALSENIALNIYNYQGIKFSEEENQIIRRFSKVFQQAYSRFLDLQKAEAQAREAQIEAALERLRSRTMGMQHSDELRKVVAVLYEEMGKLDFDIRQFALSLLDKKAGTVEWWGTGFDETILPASYIIHYREKNLKDNPFVKVFIDGVDQQIPFQVQEYKGEKKKQFDDLTFNHTGLKDLPEEVKQEMRKVPHLYMSNAFMKYGVLEVIGQTPVDKEKSEILQRFAKVFEQTYTRFLDLKNAEAQARESQIQLGLERVRARAMAMHKSEQLAETAKVLFEQFDLLGKIPDRMSIGIVNEETGNFELWVTDQKGETTDHAFLFRLDETTSVAKIYKAWKKKKASIVVDLTGQELRGWLQFLKNEVKLPINAANINDRRVHQAAFFSHGFLLLTSHQPVAEEIMKLLVRFAGVFDLTYTRFLDLQKAEAQVRESEIQLALERVRARTMAMHNSDELGQTVMVLFDELKQLGLDDMNFCGIGIMQKNHRMEAWTASGKKDSDSGLVIGTIDMKQHPMLDQVYKNWDERKESSHYVMEGQDKIKYFENINNQQGYKAGRDISKLPERTYANAFYFNEGCLYAFTLDDISKEKVDIYKRFASVFGQAYRRYLDLQIAEARAREAVKQASLDRVRGQISSMRKPKDLQQITPLIWNELKSLEVPFFRCGVFIINEKKKHVQVYLTAPEGKSLASLDLDFDLNDLTRNTVQSWREKEVFRQHWTRNEFLAWTQEMMKLRQINNPEEYQGAEDPPESLHMHFIPFAQGMLYVGNFDPLNDNKIGLVKSLAEAFSFAYARYQDFVELEDAKLSVEKALTDLKATQSQLVHAEKMASLGELTAGIAHEIQNPLNFVNNFSEVSTDLIEELHEELKNGDMEEVKAIANDLLQNLEKINNHGKRASSIVKGMLEHSRSGSGEKILTDLNSIADEYLRLAYHGLRAKDKSFNADFKTEFDPDLPKIEVIPQDIGRVLLNLINNAFYAVNIKYHDLTAVETHYSASIPSGKYIPKVTVITKNLGNQIEIRVKDNGPGIPDKIKDKIFQPFFTTKPTGQGTGLGLSMSYDIITKGHGGELKVESTKGGGTTFIILLPLEK